MVREASGGLTITTIAPSSLSSGVASVAPAYQRAFDRAPTIEADGATNKKIGLVGTDTFGTLLLVSGFLVLADSYPIAIMTSKRDIRLIADPLLRQNGSENAALDIVRI